MVGDGKYLQVDTCMDLPDTDKNNKETEKTIDCILKWSKNEENLFLGIFGPKIFYLEKSFFLTISTL